MKPERWYARLVQDLSEVGRPTRTSISCVGRVVDGVKHAHIAFEASPEEVRECFYPVDMGNSLISNPLSKKPLKADFDEWEREAGESYAQFWRAFRKGGKTVGPFVNVQYATGEFEVHIWPDNYEKYRQRESDYREHQDLAHRLLTEKVSRGDKRASYSDEEWKEIECLAKMAGVKIWGDSTFRYDTDYCRLCGNVRSSDRSPCIFCSEVLSGRLSRAYEIYKTLQYEHRGEGGLTMDRSHFYFGDTWEGRYPKEGESYVHCEMCVHLYPEHAETAWVYDDDCNTESHVYGDGIRYDDPYFWEKLGMQLDKGPEEAWNSDILTCPDCGYHFSVMWGTCKCEDSKEDEEE